MDAKEYAQFSAEQANQLALQDYLGKLEQWREVAAVDFGRGLPPRPLPFPKKAIEAYQDENNQWNTREIDVFVTAPKVVFGESAQEIRVLLD